MKSKDRSRKKTPTVPLYMRAIKRNQQWEDKEEFLSVVYWTRQCLGVVVGLLCGIIPLQGVIGMLVFAVVAGGLVYLYCTAYQCVDQEDYGGAWELLKEGMMTAFALFLVNWIITYTMFYHG